MARAENVKKPEEMWIREQRCNRDGTSKGSGTGTELEYNWKVIGSVVDYGMDWNQLVLDGKLWDETEI